MNGAQLYAVFDKIPILKDKFLGILTYKEICENRIHLGWSKCDFILINFRDLHWIMIMWINVDTIIIFDSLSGKLMPKKKTMEQIVSRCFYGLKKVIFQYGNGKLQKVGALTCSEHIIYYVLYQNLFYLKNKRFDLNYISNITKYCFKHRITPDEFVWKEIYINLELAKPPNLMKVLNWYDHHRSISRSVDREDNNDKIFL